MILPNSEVSDSVQLSRQRDNVESSISCRGPQRVIHLTSEHWTPTSKRQEEHPSIAQSQIQARESHPLIPPVRIVFAHSPFHPRNHENTGR